MVELERNTVEKIGKQNQCVVGIKQLEKKQKQIKDLKIEKIKNKEKEKFYSIQDKITIFF